jgi:tetratricopeptide (TPR) repeat protein
LRPAALANPFPGLRPFEANEDHLFFGREKEIDELLRRLRSTRFLSIIGSSGSGKSSLVRCGLISALHGGFMVQAGSTWRVAKFRPSEDPIGNLAAALNDPNVLGTRGELASTNRVLIESTLRRGTLGLVEAFRQARIPGDENLLLVVDQFEELFRFRHSRQVQNSKDESIAFVKLLLEAARMSDVPIYIVLTMRSDFIGDCMQYPGLPEAVNAGQYLIPGMTRDQLRSTIAGPVAVGGGQITQRLVLRLLNDLGDDQDQLPVLQHALMRSWDYWYRYHEDAEPLDIAHYEAVGTMQEALSLHAEEAYQQIGTGRPAEIAERIFKALTDTFSDPRGVRRPTTVKQLAAICEASETEIIEIIEVFRRPGRSFVTPPFSVRVESRSIIDISHESLMRGWKRLIEWAEQERASAGFYVRLAQAASWFEQGTAGLWRDPELQLGLQWREQNHPTAAWAEYHYGFPFERVMQFLDASKQEHDRLSAEEERERKRKLRQYQWAAVVLASLLVITGVLGWIARMERNRAQRESDRAEGNFKVAQDAVESMLSSIDRKDPSQLRLDPPELIDFRQQLLEKARPFYDRLLKGKPDNPTVLEEMAGAHFRLGEIQRISGAPDAAQSYQDAIKEYTRLSMEDPGNEEYREALGNSYNYLGETFRLDGGKKAEADAAYGNALLKQQELVQQNPQNDRYRQELARTHYNRGILRYDAKLSKDTESDFESAVELLEPLKKKDQYSSAAQDLGRVYNNFALLKESDDPSKAKEFFGRAIQIHNALVMHEPANREYKQELATFIENLSLLLFEQKQYELAGQKNLESLDLLKQLASPMLELQSARAQAERCAILLPRDPQGADKECDQAFERLQTLKRMQIGARDDFQKVSTILGYNYVDLIKRSSAPGLQSLHITALRSLHSLLPDVLEEDRKELEDSYRELSQGVSTQ